jgi:hypothetical protein
MSSLFWYIETMANIDAFYEAFDDALLNASLLSEEIEQRLLRVYKKVW